MPALPGTVCAETRAPANANTNASVDNRNPIPKWNEPASSLLFLRRGWCARQSFFGDDLHRFGNRNLRDACVLIDPAGCLVGRIVGRVLVAQICLRVFCDVPALLAAAARAATRRRSCPSVRESPAAACRNRRRSWSSRAERRCRQRTRERLRPRARPNTNRSLPDGRRPARTRHRRSAAPRLRRHGARIDISAHGAPGNPRASARPRAKAASSATARRKRTATIRPAPAPRQNPKWSESRSA